MINKKHVWVRVGDGGDYVRFDSPQATVDYLNDLKVGRVDHWTNGGMWTPNFWGRDFISLFWGDDKGEMVSNLVLDERAVIEDALEEHWL